MDFSREAQAARIANLDFAQTNAADCLRKVRIRDYIPGQVTYNLGDYPEKIATRPTEYDETLIRDLARRGVGLIQIHEEWNDAMGFHGGDKYSSLDPEGLRLFVDLCHANGIKIIPYISSGYTYASAPYFREEFTRTPYTYDGVILHYRRGSADSPDWRAFILNVTFGILDQYGFDGIYNDWGYDRILTQFYRDREHFDRNHLEYDPQIEDLLCLFYEEIHRRGGIYKLHDDTTHGIYHEKLYDYLWIGEGEKDARKMLAYRDAPLYVVPCPDKNWLPKDNPRFYFALTIPFIQFPLLTHGRPISGMGMCQPDVFYDERRGTYRKRMEISQYCRSHPNGPYVYSHWSALPDDPNEIKYWSDFLALYKPMVTEGSVVHVNIGHSPLFHEELADTVIATLFTNEKQYLVLSNIGETPEQVTLSEAWIDRETAKPVREITLNAKDICFLLKG